MRIESIEQEYIASQDPDEMGRESIVATRVVIQEVSSPCILSRLMISTLGRPGVDTDMELFNSGDRCIIIWTRPQLTLEAAQAVMSQAIAPPALPETT